MELTGYQKVAETEAAFEPTLLERHSLAGGGGKEAQGGNTAGVRAGAGSEEELEKAAWDHSPVSTWASWVQDATLEECTRDSGNMPDVQKGFPRTEHHCRYSPAHCCSSGHI